MNWKNLFQNQKLNRKFTFLIIIFTVVPISIMAGILFHYMKQNVIKENINYMEYTMQRNQDSIQTKIDSITMSTQFFMHDTELWNILQRTMDKNTLTTKEWLTFKEGEVSALERLVNNNPLLYGVRVYASSDHVQEMMPILYQNSRMEKQEWAADEQIGGWKFDYVDNIFFSYSINQDRKLIALITRMGNLGTIEAAMTMEDMFPSLYENIENEWSFFCAEDGKSYFGENESAPTEDMLNQIYHEKQSKTEISTIYMKIDGEELVVSYMPVKELSGTLVCVKDITENIATVSNMQKIFILVMLVVLIILSFLINRIVKKMLWKFYDILKSIRQVQNGDLNVVIENCGKDEMGELGAQINAMLESIRQLTQDNLKREMLVKNSEIRALQNQINAHFIYNVLESIKMMAEIDEEYGISNAVTSLGKLLRYSMKWGSNNVLVEQELEYIKNYMALINLRFDYEIFLSINIPEVVLKQEIPKMSLQPIVENAIYHGIEQLAEDTNIYIKGLIERGDCVIEITDSGKGMTSEQVEQVKRKIAGEIDSNGGSGNGIGLKNVQDRIHIAFGEKYGIEIASKLGCYTKIRVRIPFTPKTGFLDDVAERWKIG